MLLNFNFYPLRGVSRDCDPQIHVDEKEKHFVYFAILIFNPLSVGPDNNRFSIFYEHILYHFKHVKDKP